LTRVDMTTRKVDTVSFLKIPQTRMTMSSPGNGMTMMTSQMNPLPLVDEWAVLEDGTIAIVRGRDYHVDFVGADGKLTSGPKVAYEWLRLSDDAKVALIDSAKKAMDAARVSGQGPQISSSGGPTVAGGGGGMQVNITGFSMGPGGAGGAAPGNLTMPSPEFIPASDLPDYKPPFGTGAVRADRDGNVWVRTSPAKAPASGGAVYDVINKKGDLVDRIELPAGRSIIGFAPGGVVYMLARTDMGVRVERARIK
jgi:hypothetical protein